MAVALGRGREVSAETKTIAIIATGGLLLVFVGHSLFQWVIWKARRRFSNRTGLRDGIYVIKLGHSEAPARVALWCSICNKLIYYALLST